VRTACDTLDAFQDKLSRSRAVVKHAGTNQVHPHLIDDCPYATLDINQVHVELVGKVGEQNLVA